jgi:beta-xylosidase
VLRPVPRPTVRVRRAVAAPTALLLAALLATAGAVAGAAPASAKAASDTWVAEEPYTGGFPDPTVVRLGSSYVASSTTTANLNLPVMTSTDLVTWRPRPALENWADYSTWRRYDEAMVTKPTWAATRGQRDRVALMSQWAPSLAKVGDHYLAAFSAAVQLTPRHSCLGIAVASDPLGQYLDDSPTPLYCQKGSPLGAIDPDVFVDRTGTPYLLWKNEGVPNVAPPRLMSQQLTPDGTAFAPGTTPVALLTRGQAWEGAVVENPSMVRFAQRYWLLYSGNDWRGRSYAVGYATCKGPLGPCTKPTSSPILAAGHGIAGPGGADAFRAKDGTLRLAYAAWDAGRIGGSYPRRFHVARLALTDAGRLKVASRG